MKRAFSLFLALAMLFSLAACSQQEPETSPTGSQSQAASYTGTARGYGGDISVTIEVTDGVITACTIDAPDETPDIGGAQIDHFQTAIVENQGQVDTVSGGTGTSNGVIAALQDAMRQAGLLDTAEYKMTPGTYTGQSHGFSCIDFVTVDVTVDESSIVSLSLQDNFVDDQDSYENRYLCTGAFEELEPEILELQSIGVDAVTGATGSSNGIKNAIRSALEQAFAASGYSEDESNTAINAMFMTPSSKTDEVVELSCDVVVVGAGAAGTVASLAALDSGASVLNIEKTFRWGGQSMMTGGPKAYSPDTTEEQAQSILDTYEATIANHRHGEEDSQWNDPDYVSAHADEYTPVNAEAYKAVVPASGLGLQKIMEYGMAFTESMMGLMLEGGMEGMTEGGPMALPTTPEEPDLLTADSVYTFGTDGEGTSVSYYQAEKYFDTVYDNYIANGGQALLSTTVTNLTYDENGNITGVDAQGDDGTTYHVTAKAVVLATGGYGGNDELMDEWAGGGDDWLYYGWQGNDGDGIVMAMDAGAAPYNLDAYPMSHQRIGEQFITAFEVQTTDDGTQWSPNDLTVILACNPDGVFVENDGTSFRPEDYDAYNPMGGFSGAMGTYSIGSSYYVVYSADQLQAYAESGLTSNAMGFQNVGLGIPTGMALGDWVDQVMEQAVSQGFAWKVSSLSEGDALLGFEDGTLAAAYGTSTSDANADGSEFYYIMKCCGLAISSCGGVEVNENMQAVREDGTAIENLFVAGNDGFGNIMATGAEYPIGGDAGMWVFGSGYIAGEKAAALAAG